jgi:thiol-disulfide isomerase/thioredoxin
MLIRLYTILLLLLLAVPLLSEDKMVRDFKLKDVSGKEVALSDFKGKVILVNFWATWCGPCIREMPDLEKLHQAYKDKGVVVLGLTVASKEKDIPGMITRTGVSYPILLGADEVAGNFGSFNSIPQTFILNKSGQIVAQISGSTAFAEFEAEIKKHL